MQSLLLLRHQLLLMVAEHSLLHGLQAHASRNPQTLLHAIYETRGISRHARKSVTHLMEKHGIFLNMYMGDISISSNKKTNVFLWLVLRKV